MRNRTSWALLFAATLLAPSTVAKQPEPVSTEFDLVGQPSNTQSELLLTQSRSDVAVDRARVTRGEDDRTQPGSPLFLIPLAGLVLLAAAVGLHAWHDSMMNKQIL